MQIPPTFLKSKTFWGNCAQPTMEQIFSHYLEDCPFLIHSFIKKTIHDFCKIEVSSSLKKLRLTDTVLSLESAMATDILPDALLKRYPRWNVSGMDPSIVQKANSFVFAFEIERLKSKVAEIDASFALVKAEFMKTLQHQLEVIYFSPHPNDDEWDDFYLCYFSKLLTSVKAQIQFGFEQIEKIHSVKNQKKKEKFEKLKAKKTEPLIVTEDLLEKKFNDMVLSFSKRLSISNSRPSSKKPKIRQKTTNSNHQKKQGKGKHSPKPRGNAGAKKRVNLPENKEGTSSKRRRN